MLTRLSPFSMALREMWFIRCLCGVVLMVACLPLFAAPTTPWPPLSIPPKTETEWVARDVTVNGLPSQIRQFRSQLSGEEVLQYFKALWAGQPNGRSEVQTLGDWQYISTVQGPVNIAVQIRKKTEGGGSEGLISMANHVEAQTDYLPPSWPKQLDLTPMQFTESVDGPRRSYYLVALSNRSVSIAAEHVKSAFLRRGWQLQQQRPFKDASTQSGLLINMAVPGSDKTLDIVVAQPQDKAQSYVNINLVQPSGDRR